MEQRLKCTQDRVRNWLETTEKVFDFATYAHSAFLKTGHRGKR